MNINEIVDKYKVKEEFKPILSSFFEMKQRIYNLADNEVIEKIKETMYNIRGIKYSNNAKIEVAYNYIKKEIILGKNISKQMRKGGLNYTIIQSVFHELSHMYDFKVEYHTKNHLINSKNIKAAPILKKGIHLLEDGVIKNEKYILLDECLNEAKTQVLLQLGNSSSSKLKFNVYQELQSVFETLCSVNNMDYLEYLKHIEGKDINDISYMMSNDSGLPKEQIDEYLEDVAEFTINISTNAKNYINSYGLTDDEKKEYMENSFKDYEKIYKASKIYIYDANVEDKELRYDRLNIVQNKVTSMFFNKSDPRIILINVNSESKTIDDKVPRYNGQHIGISKIIIDSNRRNFLYKTRSMGFLKRLRNKFFNKKLMLNEVNTGIPLIGVSNNIELEPEYTKII